MTMTVKTYDNLPSTAVKQIVVDTEKNEVHVVYNNSFKCYVYNTENAESFDEQFLAEFDSTDFSVGKFVNDSVNSGNLTLLQESHADIMYPELTNYYTGNVAPLNPAEVSPWDNV